MQTNILNILFCSIFILLPVVFLNAQEIETNEEEGIKIEAERDSLVSVGNNLPLAETIKLTDSVMGDTLKPRQGNQIITDIVSYKAKDYMRLSQKENRMFLYNEAEITYGDIQINAGLIVIDNKKNEVYAYGIPDSTGAYSQTPVFVQGNQTVEPDSIRFNFDTERALVYNSRTQQASFNVKGEVTKRENDSVYFMKNVKFTTDDDLENPDYFFYARKIKFVPDKKIVAGLVNMYLADVPTPLGLPFGYFPMTEEKTSGFIIPSFGDSQRGYFLQNGGYYFAISDYVDLLALGDYYTNGSYAFRGESNYAKRYRYRGNVRIRYENLYQSERGFPDFSEQSVYNIQWSHSQDSKASPNSRFNASVNLGSSTYYQESVNQMNTGNFLTNTLNSSVSYSKTFPGDPQVNLSLTARHSQNTRTKTINMTLPTLQASMSRIYPFEPKTGAKKGIIENINFQYNLRAENQIKTTDSLFFTSQMFKDANYGAQHSIPVSTNFKLFNYLSVSTNANYEENWVFKTFDQRYDEFNDEVVIDTINGFDSYRTYSFSAGIGTTIYGLKNFGKDKKIQAIRHVMRPNISYNVNPGFNQYYDTYERVNPANPIETNMVDYSRFDGTLYGAPGRNFASSIGLSISNTLEAKVRSKDSTATEPEKITLLNNFSMSTSYNLAAEEDQPKLSPIALRGSIPIVKDKLDINVAGNLDIYALDNNNRRTTKLNINNGGSLFRFTNANVSFGYSFSSKDFEDEKDENDDEIDNDTYRGGGRKDDLFGKGTNLDGEFYDNEEDPFADREGEKRNDNWYNYKIPWDLRLSYTMTYNNTARQNEITSHSIMFSGDVELSPKWAVGASSGYDLKEMGFTYTQLRFQRDLNTWRLSFNWVPFSAQRSWNFFIGIKSSILSDIKYDKRRERDRSL
ncbi:LPS assembly outer membrane protein LptD (organic solvent tolerance protein OstA) [Salegentibacter echinorum]|uniref:LPS assembly outer membrane protein LptD (Organic solvent tolerance protein OstA) n=1 Tax=Salegentibacter echinorum TaxID=1073325 RepID=A0A1M5J1M4_SALEC|nr:putative LPS assembly protein LptD [Salegentibacter echinorum]SHG33913.1 LPS assembly outer membrane protein LptD (organic solvent tolerance protein OstA) [Salegentibacter echinorum]